MNKNRKKRKCINQLSIFLNKAFVQQNDQWKIAPVFEQVTADDFKADVEVYFDGVGRQPHGARGFLARKAFNANELECLPLLWREQFHGFGNKAAGLGALQFLVGIGRRFFSLVGASLHFDIKCIGAIVR